MKYYKVKSEFDGDMRTKKGNSKYRQIVGDGFFVGGQLFTPKERAKLLNNSSMFDVIDLPRSRVNKNYGLRSVDSQYIFNINSDGTIDSMYPRKGNPKKDRYSPWEIVRDEDSKRSAFVYRGGFYTHAEIEDLAKRNKLRWIRDDQYLKK